MASSSSGSDSELERLPIPAIDDFAEVLADEPRWYDLGIHLEIPANTLNDIRVNFRTNGIQRCLIEIFKIFRFRRVPVTWYDICEALLHMDNEPLVKRIRNNYILPKMRHYPVTPPISDESSDDGGVDDDGEPTEPRHRRRNRDIPIVVEIAVTEDFHRLMMFFNDIVLRVQRGLERLEGQEVINDLQYVLREQYGLKPLPPEVATMDQIFARLHPHFSFLNCRLLEFITEKFLPDEKLVQDELDEYAEKLDSFKDLPKVFELMRLLKNTRDAPGGPRIIALKLQEFWGQATLRNFERLVKMIFDQLYGLMAHLRITEGCICASWTLPSCINDITCTHLLSDLVKSTDFMMAIGVLSLKINNGVIFECPFIKDVNNIEEAVLNAIVIGNCQALKTILEATYNVSLENKLTTPLSKKNYLEIASLAWQNGHTQIVSQLIQPSTAVGGESSETSQHGLVHTVKQHQCVDYSDLTHCWSDRERHTVEGCYHHDDEATTKIMKQIPSDKHGLGMGHCYTVIDSY